MDLYYVFSNTDNDGCLWHWQVSSTVLVLNDWCSGMLWAIERERGRSELLNTLTVCYSLRSHTSPPSKWHSFVMRCRVKATQISRDTRKLSRNNVILHNSGLYLNLMNSVCLKMLLLGQIYWSGGCERKIIHHTFIYSNFSSRLQP